MDQDFYKRICRSLDFLLKQFLFGLHISTTRDEIRQEITHLLAQKSEVADFDIGMFGYGDGTIVISVIFLDNNKRRYTYKRKMN